MKGEGKKIVFKFKTGKERIRRLKWTRMRKYEKKDIEYDKN